MSKYSSSGMDWTALRKTVLERDGYLCQHGYGGCTRVATEADHVQPKSQGGVDELWNLVASCKNCNTKKGARTAVRQPWKSGRWFDFGSRASS